MVDSLDVLIDELCREINRARPGEAWTDDVFLGWAGRIASLQAALAPELHRPPPAPLRRVEALHPLTTDTFRFADVRVFGGERPIEALFQTSGTTARLRGRHALARADIYRASALRAFELLADPERSLGRLISLVPPWESLPAASLSHMLSTFARERFCGRAEFVVGPSGLDIGELRRVMDDVASPSSPPVLLFTTTLAARALLEADVGGLLPAGSLVLTTGGGKGISTQVEAETIESELAARFPGAGIGSEYGMTELLSQAYRLGAEPFQLPPWCRVLAIDPNDGGRVAHGKEGLLRFVDLANVQSAVAVQTADLGITFTDHAFTYSRRAPGARLRGCSLTFEELSGGADE